MTQGAVPQWRDISTAPKDGTLVLLADASGGDLVLVGRSWGDDFCCAKDGDAFYPQPTHWQPCPPPPEQP